jgi:uncharacterized membrane protein YbjE (DUF340 family)
MITDVALVALMLNIGLNIGSNSEIMGNLIGIGFNCVCISLCAIAFSVIATVMVEKTVLPLDKSCAGLHNEKGIGADEGGEKPRSALVWIMPGSIVAGVLAGMFLMPPDLTYILDYSLIGSLIVLYAGVGVSQGANKEVFRYVRILGLRILFLPAGIFVGSVAGGLIAGLLLDVPLYIPVLSASGMSFYSITGAYMSQVYGIEIGTYGFIVNVMREFFTVLLLPLLIKISKGSPIAGGASGNMDTMLAPVTKFVGTELGLVTLFTGTVLTFLVPIVLPVFYNIFNMFY